jgi:hypothetical protein
MYTPVKLAYVIQGSTPVHPCNASFDTKLHGLHGLKMYDRGGIYKLMYEHTYGIMVGGRDNK